MFDADGFGFEFNIDDFGEEEKKIYESIIGCGEKLKKVLDSDPSPLRVAVNLYDAVKRIRGLSKQSIGRKSPPSNLVKSFFNMVDELLVEMFKNELLKVHGWSNEKVKEFEDHFRQLTKEVKVEEDENI